VAKYGVTVLYTAPTAIPRFSVKWGPEWPKKHDLRSLRLLGTVGETDQSRKPGCGMYANSSAAKRCPIVDTWWQTETGAIMITPLGGRDAHQAGQCDPAFFRRGAGGGGRPGQSRPAQQRRQAGDPQAVAQHVARHLGRPGAV